MTQLFSNNANTTLASPYTIADGVLTVTDGSNYSSPTGGDFEVISVREGSKITIFKMTARSSNVLTVTPAQEGTTDQNFGIGAIVYPGYTAGSIKRSTCSTRGVNAQTGTSYTLGLEDEGRIVSMDNAAANTVTVPPNSSVAFELDKFVYVYQKGAGQTTIVEGAGVTIRTSETLLVKTQYAVVALLQIGTDEWILTGERELA